MDDSSTDDSPMDDSSRSIHLWTIHPQTFHLMTIHEGNNEMRKFVWCLPALALVPVDDVADASDLIAAEMPVHENGRTSYFAHTHIRSQRLCDRACGPTTFPDMESL